MSQKTIILILTAVSIHNLILGKNICIFLRMKEASSSENSVATEVSHDILEVWVI